MSDPLRPAMTLRGLFDGRPPVMPPDPWARAIPADPVDRVPRPPAMGTAVGGPNDRPDAVAFLAVARLARLHGWGAVREIIRNASGGALTVVPKAEAGR